MKGLFCSSNKLSPPRPAVHAHPVGRLRIRLRQPLEIMMIQIMSLSNHDVKTILQIEILSLVFRSASLLGKDLD